MSYNNCYQKIWKTHFVKTANLKSFPSGHRYKDSRHSNFFYNNNNRFLKQKHILLIINKVNFNHECFPTHVKIFFFRAVTNDRCPIADGQDVSETYDNVLYL